MPAWQDFEPFIVSGLALGGVYALSGIGLVVLYRATGVLYLAFGAVGALGALITWSIVTKAGAPGWVGWLAVRRRRRAPSRSATASSSARPWPSGIRWSRRWPPSG